MKQAHYPPYSPDLAPSDFFLFGYVKKSWWDITLKVRPSFLSRSESLCRKSRGRHWMRFFSSGWSNCGNVLIPIRSTLDDLSKRQRRKLVLLDRFVYATLGVGHPIHSIVFLRFWNRTSFGLKKVFNHGRFLLSSDGLNLQSIRKNKLNHLIFRSS
jgi:hypothetical protein